MARHTPRVFVDAALATGSEIELGAAKRHHLVTVLRRTRGSRLAVFNDSGREYAARLVEATRKRATVAIEVAIEPVRESPLAVTVLQAVVSAERMDYALAKAVELGATRIEPVFAERGKARPTGERLTKKHNHWQAVVEAAAEQSGRLQRPRVAPPAALADALGDARPGARLVLDPDATRGLAALEPPRQAALAVGPESGLSARELAAAGAAGWQGVGLGPRVLRAETAGPAALAAMQALWGDLAVAPGGPSMGANDACAADR